MLSKITEILNSDERRRLFSNFISLLVMQGANYLLPLLTLPYLVRILGAEYFGLLAFATATIAYFQILTDYGFNLTATKEVSIHRSDQDKLIEIFSSVMIIKCILMFLSFIILSVLVLIVERFKQNYLIYFFTFGTVIGQVLFPVWFFQGMERMKYITVLNILAKSIFTIAIFILVKDKNDYYIVPLMTSLGFIIAGFIALYIIRTKFNIKFKFQKLSTLRFYLLDGWHVFISRFYVSAYTTTNTVLLGLFTNNTVVGYYSIAEKIVVSIGGLFEPANQALYPYLVKMQSQKFSQFVNFIKKMSYLFFFIALIFFIFGELFRNSIIYIVAGSYSQEISAILTILLFRILTAPYGSLFSNSLIIMEKKSEFLKVMNYTVILNFIIVIPSIYFYGANGLAYSLITVIFTHIFLLAYYVRQSINSRILLES